MRVSDEAMDCFFQLVARGSKPDEVEIEAVLLDLRELRKAAREAVKWIDEQICWSHYHEYHDDGRGSCKDCTEQKELITKLRELAGEGK